MFAALDSLNSPPLFSNAWTGDLRLRHLSSKAPFALTKQAPTPVIHPTWFAVLTNPGRLRILQSLTIRNDVSVADLLAHSHMSDHALRRHLAAMVELGIVRVHRENRDGLTRGRPAARFILDATVRENAIPLFRLLERPLGASHQRIRQR